MRKGNHTITNLTVHIVWVTKYRYEILTGDIKSRCRELLIQMCDAMDVRILEGITAKNHVHMLIEYPPKLPISEIVKQLKGRSSKILQSEYKSLGKKYWGQHMWASGYGAWSTGINANELVANYIKEHYEKSNDGQSFSIEG